MIIITCMSHILYSYYTSITYGECKNIVVIPKYNGHVGLETKLA